MLSKKPRIGITLSEAETSDSHRWPMIKAFDYIKQEYYEAVLKSGGLPVLLPNVGNKNQTELIFESIDALIITGGVDIHPAYFKQRPHKKLSRTTENRDRFEVELIKMAMRVDMPLLGICRGHQVLNVALGGDLYQDLSCLNRKTLKHADPSQSGRNFHKVRINKDSILYDIIGKEVIEVNSSHHQVVDKIGKRLRDTAFAPDGVIEGLEHIDRNFVLSVQWHPEGIYSRSHSRKLFDYFINISRKNI